MEYMEAVNCILKPGRKVIFWPVLITSPALMTKEFSILLSNKMDNPRMDTKRIILKMCCPLKDQSFILPFSLPQAIMLPAKEIDPIINPKKIVINVPPGTGN